MAGFVPALASHVEFELERNGITLGAEREVPAGATGTLERLDLTDEDAVHERTGSVGSLIVVGPEPTGSLVVVERSPVAGVENHVLDAHALEPVVSGQLFDGHVTLHALLLALRDPTRTRTRTGK
jgi:hypothetical protein